MSKKNLDLSDIKEEDLELTSSFTDLMSRKEKKERKRVKEELIEDNNDIEEMIEERKRSTKDLTKDLNSLKEEYKKQDNPDESLGKTQILELTRQMKFNFEEAKEENNKQKKKGISKLNVIGEVSLLCIGYYIYLLVFTNYQDNKNNYLITGSIIVLLVLFFGLSVVTGKKLSKFFNILNILTILAFIIFNIYTLI
ncbi:MAG: hypothetical protein Q4E75_06125 [bacterium]|nr:hypothetical protein [bacterium]